ncbi:MAG: histidine kinase [Pirellulales bacterium]|nr:histidine kinase [Pirellulales bacterium]
MTAATDDHTPAGKVAFLSGDLMFASRVQGAAQRAGLAFSLSGSLPDSDTEAIRYVILDLSTRSSQTDSLIDQCRQRCPDAKIIAYGPHVQAAKLEAARQAGIPTVMTRGQFDAKLSSLFSA